NLIQSGANKPDEALVADGLEAAKAFIKQHVKAQEQLAAQSAKAVQEYPVFLPYADDVYAAVEQLAEAELRDIYQIADKLTRQDADDALKPRVKDAVAAKVDAGELPESAN